MKFIILTLGIINLSITGVKAQSNKPADTTQALMKWKLQDSNKAQMLDPMKRDMQFYQEQHDYPRMPHNRRVNQGIYYYTISKDSLKK